MQEIVHDAERLKELQALPLERKIQISQTRIIEWYQKFKGNVFVSFSGGKDSTVLLHMVHALYPDVPTVFANTGLEYPEIQKFARKQGAVFVTPKMRFDQVVTEYGYPLISKEVSEAIYYARRIRLKNDQQTAKRKQTELLGERKKESERRRKDLEGTRGNLMEQKQMAQTKNHLVETSTARIRRTALLGQMEQWYEYEPGNRDRWKIQGFENGTEEKSTVKSQFNKKKWLPLAQELPANISHYCCHVMKKSPLKIYKRQYKQYPYIGTLAEESRVRKQSWIRNGCNAFNSGNPSSQPLSFWTEQDILGYIVMYGLEIASVYGDIVSERDGAYYSPIGLDLEIMPNLKCTGCVRTGCIFCGFGLHLEKGETRFQRLAKTHPKQYEYCIGGGQWVNNPKYDAAAPEYDGSWKNWNPKKIWVPSKQGLGMGKVFDMVNEIYGKDFYRY